MAKSMLLAGVGIAVIAAFAGFQSTTFRKATDRDIQYDGESYKGELVEMSCRFGAFAEKFKLGQFDEKNSAMFQTADYQVEVVVEKDRNDVIKALRALSPNEEITVYGKAYKYPAGASYMVIHRFTKGFTTEYLPGDQKTITLYWNGSSVKMERGKNYTLRAPRSQEAVDVSWK